MTKFVNNSLFGKNKAIKMAKRLSVIFFSYASFPWKLNRYSYGVQFGINCTALDQSKLNNFVEYTIRIKIQINKTTFRENKTLNSVTSNTAKLYYLSCHGRRRLGSSEGGGFSLSTS